MADTGKRSTALLYRLAALISGILLPLSFSPVSFWPAGLASLAGLAWVLDRVRPGEAAIRGWIFGIGMFGCGTSWVYVSIATYGNVNQFFAVFITIAFVIAMGLFIALPCYLLQRFCVPDSRQAHPLGFATMWVFAEWFRTWFLTGFPWLFAGYAHLDSPLSAIAPVFGVMGISFVIALTAAVLYRAVSNLLEKQKPAGFEIISGSVMVASWTLAFGLSLADVRWTMPTGQTLSVAVVHGTVAQEEKFDPLLDLEIVSRYDLQTESLWGSDVILWPETAIPMFLHQSQTIIDYLGNKATESGSTLVTGIFHLGDNGDVHNSIMATGLGDGLYHKKRLVPFGEYVPLMSLVGPVLQIFDLPMSTIMPGPKQQSGLTAANHVIAPSICYEVVYPEIVRQGALTADLLVTISNDTWFGSSWGPRQHLEMAAMRALENGRYMLRATNNGLSAIIDDKGRVTSVSSQYEPDQVLTGTASLFEGLTPYTRMGNWPLYALMLGVLVIPAIRRSRR